MEKAYTQQDMDYMMERLNQAIAERNAAYNVLERIGITPEMIEQLSAYRDVPNVTVEHYNRLASVYVEYNHYDSIQDAIDYLDRYCGPGETRDIEFIQRITHRRVVHTHTTPLEENDD